MKEEMEKVTTKKWCRTQHILNYIIIGYKGKYRQQTGNTKLLGLQTDNHLNWKNRVEKIIPINPYPANVENIVIT